MPQDFNPKPGDSIALFEHEYVVQPHPQMPSMAYRQKAGRARVYQLRNDQLGQYFALKEFKKLYRKPTLIDSYRNLHRVEDFDGLRVARRQIILPTDPPAQRHPNLQYAMLMPWIHGTTWFDVLGQAREDGGGYPDPATAVGLCDRFLEIMEGLEEAGMAHTDISPGNVMVGFDPVEVQLLDLEDMHMPGASTPPEQNTGSTGYSHRGGETTWRAEGDRYAAAVLAAEMLILADRDLAGRATDEGFFTNHCHTPEGMSRFQQARPWIEKVAPGFARVFERSWYADTLEGCPTIYELRAPIKKLAVRPLAPEGPKRVETPISRQPSAGSKAAIGTRETPVVEGTAGQAERDASRPPQGGRRRVVIGVLSVVAIVVGLIAGVAYSLTGEDTTAETEPNSDAAVEPVAEEPESGSEEERAVQPGLVLDVGGLGDQGFNDSANAGLERAQEDFNVEGETLESSAPTDYIDNLTQLAEQGYDPVFAVGFLMTDAVNEVAPQFPDTNFAIMDSFVEVENGAGLVFREQEGSYLAGVVAGLMTQQDTEYTTSDEQVVGFLGGQQSPLIERYEAGYTAGVESVCPDCEVLVQYAGTTPEAFNDPARGREIATQQIEQGADIIYHASGATGAGLLEAATAEGIFVIGGVDIDQSKLVPEAPILTSVVKRLDNAVISAIEQTRNDEFPAGKVVEYGLEDGGMSLAPFGRFDEQVPQEVRDEVERARQGIIDGEIQVPDTVQ